VDGGYLRELHCVSRWYGRYVLQRSEFPFPTENAQNAWKMANSEQQKISGYYTPGTFQQYVLSPANYVTPIPDGLDSAAAAPMLCAGVTVYSALRKSNAESGAWVVLLGAGGGLGHLAVQFSARAIGHRVIGIDHSSKKDIVLESGAEHFIPVDGTSDMAAAVKELTDGLGAHAVLVLTANNAAYGSSLDLLRFGGRVVCVGIPEGEAVPMKSALPGTMVAKGLSIVGSAVGDRREALEVSFLPPARCVVFSNANVECVDFGVCGERSGEDALSGGEDG
jgi:propanol-preferring alcohol dehydrogenase